MPDTPPLTLTWKLGYGTAEDGTVVCRLEIIQGGLSQSVTLVPDDMDKLAEQLATTVRQARGDLTRVRSSGLIVPVPQVPMNGLRTADN